MNTRSGFIARADIERPEGSWRLSLRLAWCDGIEGVETSIPLERFAEFLTAMRVKSYSEVAGCRMVAQCKSDGVIAAIGSPLTGISGTWFSLGE